jgi:hypothetical protein
MARKIWTPDDDAHIDRRLGDGATYAVIGGELGVSAAAIAGRRHRRRGEELSGGQPGAVGALRALEQNLGYQRATQGGCRWVIGDPGADWQWCGKPIAGAGPQPYCAEHADISKNRSRGETRQ